LSLHIHRAGRGPALVFLHGWTMAGDIFADAFARLSDRFTCLAPDLPGHGRTTSIDPTINASIDALDAWFAQEQLANATLIGWSLGAAVAWRYLERFGASRIAGIVSLDMSPAILNDEHWQLGLARQNGASVRAKAQRFAEHWPDAARGVVAGLFAFPQGTPLLSPETAYNRVLANDPAALSRFWTSLCDSDSRAFIPRMPVPLLAVHGAQSRLYPIATGEWLAEQAPGGRLLVFEQSGHSPHLEEPEAFAEAIADFASR
jgi:pimeloyl-[acyl-carrier protein] methyl ester esterase